jgi:F-type H+-transporting ATPase subunit g
MSLGEAKGTGANRKWAFAQNLYKSGEWKRYGIYAVEAYGIFKLGEMIGRR